MHDTSAQGWCTGKTQRDGMGREVGAGIGMGNTCKSMDDSCQCMQKPLQYCKVISLQLIKISEKKKISSSALSLLYGQTLTSIHNYRKNHSFNYMDLCWKSDDFVFNTLSSFVITFLPGIKLSSNFTATVTICSDDLPLTT